MTGEVANEWPQVSDTSVLHTLPLAVSHGLA